MSNDHKKCLLCKRQLITEEKIPLCPRCRLTTMEGAGKWGKRLGVILIAYVAIKETDVKKWI